MTEGVEGVGWRRERSWAWVRWRVMARRERYLRDSRGMMRAAVVGDVRERLPVSEARGKQGEKKDSKGAMALTPVHPAG